MAGVLLWKGIPMNYKPQADIEVNEKGELRALNGKDAVQLMRIRIVMSGIKMNLATGGRMQLTSTRKGGGIKNLLQIASSYTKKKYTTGEKSKQQAYDDLKKYHDELLGSFHIEVKPDRK